MTRDKKLVLKNSLKLGLKILNHFYATERSCVFSPVCIEMALAIAHSASSGYDQQRIRSALIPVPQNEVDQDAFIKQYYNDLRQSLIKEPAGVQVSLATNVYYPEGRKPLLVTAAAIKLNYDAEMLARDLEDREEMAEEIDRFITENEPGRYEPGFDEEFLGNIINYADSTFITASSFYFNAKWQYKNGTFNFRKDYFEHKGIRNYAENDGWQMVSLYYEDTEYSMNYFFPNFAREFDELLRDMTPDIIVDLMSRAEPRLVDFRLRKKEIRTTFKLEEILEIVCPGEKLRFNRLLAGRPIRSQIVHSTVHETSEHGTGTKETNERIEPVVDTSEMKTIFTSCTTPHIFIITHKWQPIQMGMYY